MLGHSPLPPLCPPRGVPARLVAPPRVHPPLAGPLSPVPLHLPVRCVLCARPEVALLPLERGDPAPRHPGLCPAGAGTPHAETRGRGRRGLERPEDPALLSRAGCPRGRGLPRTQVGGLALPSKGHLGRLRRPLPSPPLSHGAHPSAAGSVGHFPGPGPLLRGSGNPDLWLMGLSSWTPWLRTGQLPETGDRLTATPGR